jgi:regulatory protein
VIRLHYEDFDKALHFGLKALSVKSRSCSEFHALLSRKGFGEEVIVQVIEHLQHLRYLDDKKYALDYAITLAKRRLWGKLRIQIELRNRGISEQDINKVLKEWTDEIDEKEMLEKAVKKKLKMLGSLDDDKKIGKLYRYLKRKGFLQEDIMTHIKCYKGSMDHEIG